MRGYEIAPLPGQTSIAVPPQNPGYMFGGPIPDAIMANLRKSRIASAGKYGTKVYLANFAFPSHDLDPRNLARDPTAPNGFLPSRLLFKRKKPKGFRAYCAITMPTPEAAQKVIDKVIGQGIIEREVRISPGVNEYPTIRNSSRVTSSTKPVTNGVAPQHSQPEPLKPANSSSMDTDASEVVQAVLKAMEATSQQIKNTLRAKGEASGLSYEQYCTNQHSTILSEALKSTTTEERVHHFNASKTILELRDYKGISGKTDAEVWPMVFLWEEQLAAVYSVQFEGGVQPEKESSAKHVPMEMSKGSSGAARLAASESTQAAARHVATEPTRNVAPPTVAENTPVVNKPVTTANIRPAIRRPGLEASRWA